jgi:hypothetical protein
MTTRVQCGQPFYSMWLEGSARKATAQQAPFLHVARAAPTRLANSYCNCCDGLPISCNFFRSASPKTNLPHVQMGETVAATIFDAGRDYACGGAIRSRSHTRRGRRRSSSATCLAFAATIARASSSAHLVASLLASRRNSAVSLDELAGGDAVRDCGLDRPCFSFHSRNPSARSRPHISSITASVGSRSLVGGVVFFGDVIGVPVTHICTRSRRRHSHRGQSLARVLLSASLI